MFVTSTELNQINKDLVQLQKGYKPVLFDPINFQQFIDNNYVSGVLAYLKMIDQQIDQQCKHKPLILQYFLELVSLVYPKTSACYSIIPSELKTITWSNLVNPFEIEKLQKAQILKLKHKSFVSSNNHLKKVVHHFEKNFSLFIPCLVSITLCNILIRSLGKQNCLLLSSTSIKKPGDPIPYDAPRIKTATWVNSLSRNIRTHIEQKYWFGDENNSEQINEKKLQIGFESLNDYCQTQSLRITQCLINNNLFVNVKTIDGTTEPWNKKTTGYLVWVGRDLLAMPQGLTLPMVVPPKPWHLNHMRGG